MNAFPFFLASFKEEIIGKQVVLCVNGKDHQGTVVNLIIDSYSRPIGGKPVHTKYVVAVHLEDSNGNPTFLNADDIQSIKMSKKDDEPVE